jgi:hypothetical protein
VGLLQAKSACLDVCKVSTYAIVEVLVAISSNKVLIKDVVVWRCKFRRAAVPLRASCGAVTCSASRQVPLYCVVRYSLQNECCALVGGQSMAPSGATLRFLRVAL